MLPVVLPVCKLWPWTPYFSQVNVCLYNHVPWLPLAGDSELALRREPVFPADLSAYKNHSHSSHHRTQLSPSHHPHSLSTLNSLWSSLFRQQPSQSAFSCQQ